MLFLKLQEISMVKLLKSTSLAQEKDLDLEKLDLNLQVKKEIGLERIGQSPRRR